MAASQTVVGWDIGGAHIKACLARDGCIVDVAQWRCPLWLGVDQLHAVLRLAAARWPVMDTARHAVTMTGEMADVFADREDGVLRIGEAVLAHWPAERVRFYAGDAGWTNATGLATHWPQIASANWLATATHVARRVDGPGVLVDIGSTTTDLIAFAGGKVTCRMRCDADRLVSGELAYHGVVRTPLCALAQRIAFRGVTRSVMNEFFATTADVYRLTGELDPAHDLHPPADNAAKDAPATRKRLARMIGLDAREAGDDEWVAFAGAWRAAQLRSLGEHLRQVLVLHALGDDAQLVAAGCGDFLVPAVAVNAGIAPERVRCEHYADVIGVASRSQHAGVQVCAPSVAVAMLFAD